MLFVGCRNSGTGRHVSSKIKIFKDGYHKQSFLIKLRENFYFKVLSIVKLLLGFQYPAFYI